MEFLKELFGDQALTFEQLSQAVKDKQFRYPERLIRMNGKLKSIPYKPEPKHPER